MKTLATEFPQASLLVLINLQMCRVKVVNNLESIYLWLHSFSFTHFKIKTFNTDKLWFRFISMYHGPYWKPMVSFNTLTLQVKKTCRPVVLPCFVPSATVEETFIISLHTGNSITRTICRIFENVSTTINQGHIRIWFTVGRTFKLDISSLTHWV